MKKRQLRDLTVSAIEDQLSALDDLFPPSAKAGDRSADMTAVEL